jgi:hypothetical protein
MTWLKKLWLKLWWWFKGGVQVARLQDLSSPVRNEAEEAIAKVVYQSNIAPDCVVASVVRGGTAIILIHSVVSNDRRGRPYRDDSGRALRKGQQECFIGRSYDHAADKALEWLAMQDGKLSTGVQSSMNRRARRSFDVRRRRAR